MGRSKTSKVTLKSKERRLQCLELRKQGHTFESIGKVVGISLQAAHVHVTKALDALIEHCNETADQLRTVEHQRLEKQYQSAWYCYDIAKGTEGYAELTEKKRQKAIRPDPSAMSRALETARKTGESIRKLYGLDSPEKHEHALVDGAVVTFNLMVDGEPVKATNDD